MDQEGVTVPQNREFLTNVTYDTLNCPGAGLALVGGYGAFVVAVGERQGYRYGVLVIYG